MVGMELLQVLIYMILLGLLACPLGNFIAKVLEGEQHFLSRPLNFIERLIYKLACIKTTEEMTWKRYTLSFCLFNLLGAVFLFFLLVTQGFLPLNPEKFPSVPFWLAINTTISFVTNTNWQAYSGEVTMSYLSQMLGLGVQNFLSPACGLCIIAVLARGLKRQSTHELGNFWVDLVRSTLYILLPLSFLLAMFLISQGVVQNFLAYLDIHTLEGVSQKLPFGPAASQIAIKQLGTNGGGFFGLNSTHPFENPSPLSNFFEMLALLLIPAALPLAFGKMVKNKRHGFTIFATMFGLFVLIVGAALYFEFAKNPLTQTAFMEGKEVRFGVGNSVLWAIATTLSSNGSVNAMLSSMSPLAGGLSLLNIMLGEVIFGGVGSGLYGMLLFVILAVFIAGLMVGRTPEYLGKKIEAAEIKLAVIGILSPSIVILIFSAIACMTDQGLASLSSKGPHGLTEILYAFSSAAGNNGSAFAGLNANTNFYNILTGLAMLIGRFAVIVPVLAIAGQVVSKKTSPPSSGTFPTEGLFFAFLLTAIVIIIGALTFFPALCLGPISEHFLMLAGRSF